MKKATVASIIGFLIAATGIGAYYVFAGGASPASSRLAEPNVDANNPAAELEGQNFCNGQAWTLDRARANVPYRVLEAHTDLANPSNMTHVWRCPDSQLAIALEYAPGVKVSLAPTTLDDPAAAWVALAAQDPGVVTVGTIRGVPGVFTDPAKDATGTAPGGVEFVEDGIQVAVIGNGRIPLDQLREVAESLR